MFVASFRNQVFVAVSLDGVARNGNDATQSLSMSAEENDVARFEICTRPFVHQYSVALAKRRLQRRIGHRKNGENIGAYGQYEQCTNQYRGYAM